MAGGVAELRRIVLDGGLRFPRGGRLSRVSRPKPLVSPLGCGVSSAVSFLVCVAGLLGGTVKRSLAVIGALHGLAAARTCHPKTKRLRRIGGILVVTQRAAGFRSPVQGSPERVLSGPSSTG